MRMIVQAHLVDDDGCTERVQLYTFDRPLTTDPLAMSLAEGKALLAAAQQHLVSGQCDTIASEHAQCDHCQARLGLKGWHQRQIKTVLAWLSSRALAFVIASAQARREELHSARSHG